MNRCACHTDYLNDGLSRTDQPPGERDQWRRPSPAGLNTLTYLTYNCFTHSGSGLHATPFSKVSIISLLQFLLVRGVFTMISQDVILISHTLNTGEQGQLQYSSSRLFHPVLALFIPSPPLTA